MEVQPKSSTQKSLCELRNTSKFSQSLTLKNLNFESKVNWENLVLIYVSLLKMRLVIYINEAAPISNTITIITNKTPTKGTNSKDYKI